MEQDGAEWKRSMLFSAKRRELHRGGLGTFWTPSVNQSARYRLGTLVHEDRQCFERICAQFGSQCRPIAEKWRVLGLCNLEVMI